MTDPTHPLKPSPNQSAVLHWADGRIWNGFLKDEGGGIWHFRTDGRMCCFKLSVDVDEDGVAIWRESAPDTAAA